MIICALLLRAASSISDQPPPPLRDARAPLLNVSVAASFTHFASPGPDGRIEVGWDPRSCGALRLEGGVARIATRDSRFSSAPSWRAAADLDVPDGPERRVPPSITAVHLGSLP